MEKHPILFLALVGLFLFRCGGKPAEVQQEEVHQALDTSSLFAAYTAFYAKRSDWLPKDPNPEVGKINPVDEALKDTAFFVFREQLREAVANRDIFPVLQALDEHVKVDFGGGGGVKAFVEKWNLESESQTNDSGLWPVMDRILSLGGTFSQDGKSFYAPYAFSLWPEEGDPFSRAVLTGQGIRVRERPNPESPVVKMLSYDVVDVLETTEQTSTIDGETYPWKKIRTPDGKEGFVWAKYLYAPFEYRIGFGKRDDGTWRIDLFVSGD